GWESPPLTGGQFTRLSRRRRRAQHHEVRPRLGLLLVGVLLVAAAGALAAVIVRPSTGTAPAAATRAAAGTIATTPRPQTRRPHNLVEHRLPSLAAPVQDASAVPLR